MRCETCQGDGFVLCLEDTEWGQLYVPRPCEACGGTTWAHCCEGERPDLVPEEKGLFARKRKRLAKYEED